MDDFNRENSEEVLRLLKERRRIGYTPNSGSERKLGLVVEGGGMRGVLSAGSLLALDLLGFRECFDSIFAVSAGSVNAAYFLSGQGRLGISVYFDSISNRRFINGWRFWKVVDVDFVYDQVVVTEKPLNENEIRGSQTTFFVSATDVQTGKNVLLDARDRTSSIARMLKASSALPVVYNRIVPVGQEFYIDGGISGGIPVDWALASGCTDLAVLLSRPESFIAQEASLIERIALRMCVGLRFPTLYKSLIGAAEQIATNRAIATGRHPVSANIAPIFPDQRATVGRMTISREELVQGAMLSALKVAELLEESPAPIYDAFESFLHSDTPSETRS